MLLINPDLNVNSTDAEKYAAFVEAVVTGKVRYDWLEIGIFNDMKSNILTNNPNLHEIIDNESAGNMIFHTANFYYSTD